MTNFLESLFGPSWRTELSGWLVALPGAFLAFVQFASTFNPPIHFPPWLTALAAFIAAGGALSLGRNAGDKQVLPTALAPPTPPDAGLITPNMLMSQAQMEAKRQAALASEQAKLGVGTGANPVSWK